MKLILKTLLILIAPIFISFNGIAQWNLTGNNTTAPNNVIGTINGTDVIFKRQDKNAMTIKSPYTGGSFPYVNVPYGMIIGSETIEYKVGGGQLQLSEGLELGIGQTKASSSGRIEYYGGTTNDHYLTIIGGGTRSNNQVIKFLNQGGASFSGKVAIGPKQAIGEHSDYKLSVDGKIVAQSIAVTVDNTTNWADFVFKKDYNLTPLLEVEKYIKKEGHLRGVPTTEEVMKDGLDLAQMNARLLEKVEELTLYMIELKKENDKMKKDIEVLKGISE